MLPQGATAETLELSPLIQEALQHNRELLAAESRIAAAGFRITQARGLPDPLVSFGYQNEGFTSYTYGQELGAQWMYSVTQALPFPGKRDLRENVATADAEGLPRGV